jgi:aspartate racemase
LIKSQKKIIGIVGGVGPYVDIDLIKKIRNQTDAKTDQEHLSIVLLSFPQEIEDRTDFILGKTKINPAYAICDVISKLEKVGAKVIGIPCNTVHAPQIFQIIEKELNKRNSKIKLVNIVEESVSFIRENYTSVEKVGILGTKGTYKSKVYEDILKAHNFQVVMPDTIFIDIISDVIYSSLYGLKVLSSSLSDVTMGKIIEAINHLGGKGAEVVILGCSELPLAISGILVNDVILIDPNLILARSLIREIDPQKLKPFKFARG